MVPCPPPMQAPSYPRASARLLPPKAYVRTYPARNTKLASPPIMARREELTLPPFLHVG